jgi:hypothetical protein
MVLSLTNWSSSISVSDAKELSSSESSPSELSEDELEVWLIAALLSATVVDAGTWRLGIDAH